ncbi:hypothetical protein ACT54M_08430 [Leptospira santarosai]|uniref:hypothetical protein n=1 Tax=Leptospira TaxID=171 RepID=UPI000517DB14|nr:MULTISPECIES: hypothetical protein [Leptospira]OLY61042.1 hypothetical protein BV917_07805 [Leptospira santarosai serovar Guaricura]
MNDDIELITGILFYTFWITIFGWFLIAVITRAIVDCIMFVTSWFRSEPERIDLQTYVSDAIGYKGEFKDRVMAKALLRMAREVDLLRDKLR